MIFYPLKRGKFIKIVELTGFMGGSSFILKPGDYFWGNKVISYLGGGHFGHTYKMEHPLLGLRVFKLATEDKNISSLWKEVETQAKILNHPNIVKIYDFFTDVKPPFVVMEYVEGGNLKELISTGATRNSFVALDIAKQIAFGLSYAHSKGVIHGDLKPENILIGENNIKIADFGLSRVIKQSLKMSTSESSSYVVGTPQYMAPEIIYGKSINEKSDIYSLGLIISEMLGRAPGEYVQLRKINPSVTPELEEIVNACLANENERFANVNMLLDAIKNYNSHYIGYYQRKGDLIAPMNDNTLQDQDSYPYIGNVFVAVILFGIIFGFFCFNNVYKTKKINQTKLIFLETGIIEDLSTETVYSTYLDKNKKISNKKRILLTSEQDGYINGKPVVSPDTNWIAYCRGDNGSLMIKPFTGGVATSMLPGKKNEKYEIIYEDPQWKDINNIVVSRGIKEGFDIKRKEPIMINIKTGKITPLKSD